MKNPYISLHNLKQRTQSSFQLKYLALRHNILLCWTIKSARPKSHVQNKHHYRKHQLHNHMSLFSKKFSFFSKISQHLSQQILSIIPYKSLAGCNLQGKSLISDSINSFRIFKYFKMFSLLHHCKCTSLWLTSKSPALVNSHQT